jgi:hypothetical protein
VQHYFVQHYFVQHYFVQHHFVQHYFLQHHCLRVPLRETCYYGMNWNLWFQFHASPLDDQIAK